MKRYFLRVGWDLEYMGDSELSCKIWLFNCAWHILEGTRIGYDPLTKLQSIWTVNDREYS